jgi:hypothetical protein
MYVPFSMPEYVTDGTKDAIKALNTLQSNASVVNAIRQSGGGMNKQAIPEMIDWCRRIGYEVCGSPSLPSLPLRKP